MAFTFLHLSDSHFLAESEDSYQFDKTTKALLKTLNDRKDELCLEAIFFTGDLSAKGKDFTKVRIFFDELLVSTGLKERFGRKAKRHLFVVPGNHDVNREKTCFVQRTLSSNDEADIFFDPKKSENRLSHIRRFEEYADFYNSYFKGIREFKAQKDWFSEILKVKHEPEDIKVGVIGFNSASFSQDDQDINKLWIGERTCRTAFEELNKNGVPDIVITLHHHPFNWLNPIDAEGVSQLICKKANIDLFGHMHSANTEIIGSAYGELLHLQAGPLFEGTDKPKRAFICQINFECLTAVIEPITDSDTAHDIWVIDTTVFPTDPGYKKEFNLSLSTPLSKKTEEHKKSLKETQPYHSRLNDYIDRTKSWLKKEGIERFIDLGLSNKSNYSLETENLQMRRSPSKTYSIKTVAKEFSEKQIIITGEPGAGKTTLLKELALEYAQTQEKIPIFVRMGLYSLGNDIFKFLDLREFDSDEVLPKLNNGEYLIIFDGVNEAPCDNIDDVFSALIDFIHHFPKNQYLLSCRLSEFPEWVQEDLEEMVVLPVPQEEVERQLMSCLGEKRGAQIFHKLIYEDRYNRIRELCGNPLLLAMVISIYRDGSLGGSDLASTRSSLYETFMNKLSFHQKKKRPSTKTERKIPEELNEEFLSVVGYEMQIRELVYASEKDFQKWLADNGDKLLFRWSNWWGDNFRPSNQDLYYSLIKSPQIKGVEIACDELKRFSYLHQSFGEYYAALYIYEDLKQKEHDYQILDFHILDKTRRQWEVVTFLAGLMDDVSPLLTYLKRKAQKTKNQSLLVLAGQCIRDSQVTNSKNADDICIRMIDAFKYWNIPFDYDLIYGVKQVSPYLTNLFPHRLLEDLQRFTEKYVHKLVPVELKHSSEKNLIRNLEHGDYSLSIDAAHTLGRRKNFKLLTKKAITKSLLTRLESAEGDLREHIIIALKELADNESMDALLFIIDNKDESPRARAYALNALGNIGDSRAAIPVINYLRDHTNPYRDSASWSLQYIAKASSNTSLVKEIKSAYYGCLISETNDNEGKYARGNILYSLSELGAEEFADDIINWIKTETDPYVLEDGVNAIGVLGGKEAITVLTPFLKSEDPVIRMKTVESLARLKATTAINEIKLLLNDYFLLVQESAAEAIETLEQ